MDTMAVTVGQGGEVMIKILKMLSFKIIIDYFVLRITLYFSKISNNNDK